MTTIKCPVSEFLVQLGQIVLVDKYSTEWFDMEELEKLCRQHSLRLDGKTPNRSDLENELRKFFGTADEFIKDGIDVLGYERRIGWDLCFMMRFYRHFTLPAEAVKEAA